MKWVINILLLLLMVFIWSCKKEPSPGDCFKTTGSLTSEERIISGFHNVVLKNNVNLFLKNGVANKLTVEAGKNLLSKIKTEVNENGNLVLSNENRCNWIRNYNTPVNVYLEYNGSFDTLFYASIGDVENQEGVDTLFFGDNFCIQIDEGAGDFDLNIKTGFLRLIFNYGTCNVNLTGKASIVSVFSGAWGQIDITGVDCPKAWVINSSSNDMYLYASEELVATTRALGNIYVSGNPKVEFHQEGEGNIILVP
jgi:hypothetical protein